MKRRLWIAAAVLEIAVLAASCGARSSLREPTLEEEADAGPDVTADVRTDPVEDPIEEDIADVVEEGLPECDPEALYVYLVTEQTVLYRYDPSTNGATPVGSLACPANGATPFSMGVDRKGRAYVVYNDGSLYLVDVNDASCEPLEFEPGQQGFLTFGMGFAIDDDMLAESLYVAEINFEPGVPSLGLGRIDTNTLVLDYIGPFSEDFGKSTELTSSDDGQLYGYTLDALGNGGHVIRIDKETAEILEETLLPVGQSSSALAFARWEGDFYIFTSPGGPTTVTKYSPSDGNVAVVATLNETVVGAGVSTCSRRR